MINYMKVDIGLFDLLKLWYIICKNYLNIYEYYLQNNNINYYIHKNK
jgi:hypothetical protein